MLKSYNVKTGKSMLSCFAICVCIAFLSGINALTSHILFIVCKGKREACCLSYALGGMERLNRSNTI